MNKAQVNFKLPIDHIQYLRYLARFKSIENGKDIPYTDLVRQAVEALFPLPDDFDPFTMDMSLASGVFHKE